MKRGCSVYRLLWVEWVDISTVYLVLVGGKVEDEPGGAKHGDDEESRTEDPPALVVVPLDLEDGDAVEQAQHQEDGRVHVQQQERFL